MTKEQFKSIAIYATKANVETFYPLLTKFMADYNIVGKLREAAFLAQIIHESGSFKYTKEIASGKAYEGRKDLGNVNAGDGVRFKGRGLIQITGRANYQDITECFGVEFVDNPELLEQPEWAARSACWWWNDRGLNRLADAGKFIEITKRINGGTNGLKDRQEYYNRAMEVL